MHISLVLLFCFSIVMVNSTTTKRRVVVNNGRRTKAPTKQSAYTYLRFVRGTQTCSRGICPFWERHGRSFVSLRCYAKQYRECTCLHRMCFSSCMFSRQVCNEEMVQCLKQICPRCMPASAQAMCSIYDSVAQQVAEALSVFACYPCCPVIQNTNNSTNGLAAAPIATAPLTNSIGITTTPAIGNNGLGVSQNAANRPTNGVNQSNNGGLGNTNVQGNATPLPGVASNNGLINSNNGNGANLGSQVRRQTIKRAVTNRQKPTAAPRPATVRGSNIKNNVRNTV